jgi:hypothetical protein
MQADLARFRLQMLYYYTAAGNFQLDVGLWRAETSRLLKNSNLRAVHGGTAISQSGQ